MLHHDPSRSRGAFRRSLHALTLTAATLAPLAASQRTMDGAVPAAEGAVFYSPIEFADAVDESVPAASTEGMGVDLTRLYFDVVGSEHWVRGASYKASARPDGFTFIPFLGSDAAKNYPTSFRLESATLGRQELPLNETATVQQDGHRFVLERGAVDVRYDLDLDQVEQTFAIDAAGANADLVLGLRVTTELVAEASQGGFLFRGPDGGMEFGAATVLDGSGRSASAPMTLEGNRLQITVPAEFLNVATGMIVVDPILNSYVIDNAPRYQGNVDVAYDLTTDSFVWAFEDKFSSTDLDIYAVSREAIDGSFITAGFVDMTTEYWSDVSVANLNGADVTMVIAERSITGTASPQREIVGRIYSHVNDAYGPTLVIGNVTGSWFNRGSDVGGSGSTAASEEFAVVWCRRFPGTDNWDGRMRLVEASGTLGPVTALTLDPDSDTVSVCVSKSTGNAATTNVRTVGIIEDLGDRELEVQALQFNAAGLQVTPLTTLAGLATGVLPNAPVEIDVSDAVMVEGVPTYALVVENPSVPIASVVLHLATGSQLLNSVSLHEAEHSDRLKRRRSPRLATTRDEFLVSYREAATIGSEGYVTAFDVTELRYVAVAERRAPMGTSMQTRVRSGVEMASRFSGGNTSSRYVGIGWDTGGGGASDIMGVTHFANNGQSPAFQYCYGNKNSTGERGFIRLEGTRSAGGSKTMVASGLPLGESGYFIVGTGFTDQYRPGGSNGRLCVGGSIGTYPSGSVIPVMADGTVRLSFDPSAIHQPGGAVPGMAGQFWQFQFWHTDSAAANPTSNYTNAVTILLN